MKTDHPSSRHTPQLRRLWQEAFGDTDAFLDSFYRTAFSPDRCLCIFSGDQPVSVLYWIDCALDDQKLAYIYAVVTAPEYRGRGLCRKLLSDTHALLAEQGYAGAVLVPQKEALRQMYTGMGYRDVGGLAELACEADDPAVPLRAIGPAEFALLRRNLLPAGSVIQEGRGLSFLAEQLQFYAGADFLLAAFAENGILHGVELLGNESAAPGILRSLGFSRGCFRTPGKAKPFAMFHPVTEAAKYPEYFGFAFD